MLARGTRTRMGSFGLLKCKHQLAFTDRFTTMIDFQPRGHSLKLKRCNSLILLLWLVLLFLASQPFRLHRLRPGKFSEECLVHFTTCTFSLNVLTVPMVPLGCLDGV